MNNKMITKNKPIRSKKITQSASGEDCSLRLTGICNFNPETTVFAHVNGAGMSLKAHDIHGCYACSDCHDWLDARKNTTEDRGLRIKEELFRAMMETQSKLIQKGLIKIS